MRCFNCGWDNHEDAQVCEKCKRPMRRARVHAAASLGNDVLNNTVVLNASETHQSKDTELQAVLNCLRCGSPVTAGTEQCPVCGWRMASASTQLEATMYDVESLYSKSSGTVKIASSKVDDATSGRTEHADSAQESAANQCRNCGAIVPKGHTYCPRCGMSVGNATVRRPIRHVAESPHESLAPKCSLMTIAEEHESMTEVIRELEGPSIVLNRKNTEPDNTSITSKEQALLTYTDGEWYIEDKSEYHTTYIQVNSKCKISDGDVIVLGDRRFLFRTK